ARADDRRLRAALRSGDRGHTHPGPRALPTRLLPPARARAPGRRDALLARAHAERDRRGVRGLREPRLPDPRRAEKPSALLAAPRHRALLAGPLSRLKSGRRRSNNRGKMDSGLYIAASGMLAEMTRQEQISNELANVNTPGFKAD